MNAAASGGVKPPGMNKESDLLYQQAAKTGVDTQLVNKFQQLMDKSQKEMCNAFLKIPNGIFQQLDHIIDETRGLIADKPSQALNNLAKINQVLQRLSLLHQAATKGEAELIDQQLKILAQENFLGTTEQKELLCNMILKLIKERKFQAAEFEKIYPDPSYKCDLINHLIENNRLLEAVPFAMAINAENSSYWLDQIFKQYLRQIPRSMGPQIGKAAADFLQEMVEAGASLQHAEQWCKNYHPPVLQRLIFLGVKVNQLEQLLEAKDRKKEILIIKDADEILKEVLTQMKAERLEKLKRLPFMENIKDPMILVSDYCSDEDRSDEDPQEIVRRCVRESRR